MSVTSSRTFFICALPRSATSWLANFFTADGVFCHHEGIVGCADMEEYVRRMTLRDYYMVGDSDSALAPFAAKVRERFPTALWVGIDREPLDVAQSLTNAGLPMSADGFQEMVALHQKVLKNCDIVVDFATLFLTETLRNLWTEVTGMRFDERRARMLQEFRLTPDLRRYTPRYLKDIPLTMRASG